MAAWAASHTKHLPGSAFRPIVGRQVDTKRTKKAAMAVAHEILIAYAIMDTPSEAYRDLGYDWFDTRDDPERRKLRLVRQLEALGLKLTLEPAA